MSGRQGNTPNPAGLLRVRISRLRPDVALPEYQTAGAAAFDLAAAVETVVAPGQVALVPTGIAVQVPAGMFLGIFARSSTPLKRGLMVANGVGVVDPDYCGPADEVMIAVLNVTAAPVTVGRGDRIAQGIILEAPRVAWEETTVLGAESRGGFGTT